MVVEYKCPSCGSNMVFESSSQKMSCEHCGTKMTLSELNAALDEGEEEENDQGDEERENFGAEDMELIHYKCPSCGAELMTDEHTVATFCSFCGNPTLIAARLSGEKSPVQLIPFHINRDQAKEIYRAWCKKGVLTPKDFLSSSTIDKISGLYVPFWLYDYGVRAQIQAECTKVRVERRGDYQYTHTDYFHVYREVTDVYERIPADASEKMPDDVMDKLEPFQYEGIKPFDMPYLSGYLAEKYNYTSSQMAKRVESRVKDFIRGAVRGTVTGYMTTHIMQEHIQLHSKGAKYTMFPVWILNYRYKGKTYQFALNGQTGKIVAERPISGKRAAACFGMVSVLTFVVSMLIGGVIL